MDTVFHLPGFTVPRFGPIKQDIREELDNIANACQDLYGDGWWERCIASPAMKKECKGKVEGIAR